MTPLENNSALFAIYTIPEGVSKKLQEGASSIELYQYNNLAKRYNAKPVNQRVIKLAELQQLEFIFGKMTNSQKKEAQPFPECPPSPQDSGATQKQLSEYNALAKKYNQMIAKNRNITIRNKDVNRLTYIYNLMSQSQRNNAEPYPDFPPMPEPPQPPSPIVQKGEVSNIPPPPAEPEVIEVTEEEEIKDLNEAPSIIEVVEIQENEVVPPPPPTPPSPLDYAIKMAKKNAIFYFKGKEISSDKAIELLKKNNALNMDSRSTKGKRPVVKLSIEPIVIEN